MRALLAILLGLVCLTASAQTADSGIAVDSETQLLAALVTDVGQLRTEVDTLKAQVAQLQAARKPHHHRKRRK